MAHIARSFLLPLMLLISIPDHLFAMEKYHNIESEEEDLEKDCLAEGFSDSSDEEEDITRYYFNKSKKKNTDTYFLGASLAYKEMVQIEKLAISSDGKQIVASIKRGYIGEKKAENVYAILFLNAKTGKYIEKKIETEMTIGKEVACIKIIGNYVITLHEKISYLKSDRNTYVNIWDLESGECLKTFILELKTNHRYENYLECKNDDTCFKSLSLKCSEPSLFRLQLTIYDSETKKSILIMGDNETYKDNNKYIISEGCDSIQVCDSESKKCLYTFKKYVRFTVTPDNKYLILWDIRNEIIDIFDLASGEYVKTIDRIYGVTTMVASNTSLVITSFEEMCIYKLPE